MNSTKAIQGATCSFWYKKICLRVIFALKLRLKVAYFMAFIFLGGLTSSAQLREFCKVSPGILNVLFNLDQRRWVVVLTAMLPLTNVISTAATLQLGVAWCGDRFALAVPFTMLLGLWILNRKLQNLEYQTFMLQQGAKAPNSSSKSASQCGCPPGAAHQPCRRRPRE